RQAGRGGVDLRQAVPRLRAALRRAQHADRGAPAGAADRQPDAAGLGGHAEDPVLAAPAVARRERRGSGDLRLMRAMGLLRRGVLAALVGLAAPAVLQAQPLTKV